MFALKKLIPSLIIEGKEKKAGIIYINTKNNIFEDIEEEVNMHGGLAHPTAGGAIALFLDGNDDALIHAASQIMQKAKESGVRSKIGIHVGDVIVQEIPGEGVRYSSIRNSVATAKKLALVENGIIISDELYRKIGKGLRVERTGNGWLVKGFSDGRYLR